MSTQLEQLQSLLYRLITAVNGVAEGLAAERELGTTGLDALVLGDDRLSAEARVDIYANMYFHRILDALKEDFPATLAVLGADNFHNLVTGYLLEYPPTQPSISECGRHLAAYLRRHPMRERAPFIADLARLERASVEVFQAPDTVTLEPDALRSIAPADWPALKFRIQPAAQILALGWQVSKLLRAVEEHREWKAAEQGAVKVLVWRNNARVFYRDLEKVEADSLKAISHDATFSEICDLVAADTSIEDPIATINRMLARWLSDNLLTSIPSPCTPSSPRP
jgi:hypothetical protein